MSETHSVTLILDRIRDEQPGAKVELIELINDRLLRLAQSKRRYFNSSLSAQDLRQLSIQRILPTNEVEKAANRSELFSAFARAMKQILIDHYRRTKSKRHGGEFQRQELDDVVEEIEKLSQLEISALDEGLSALEVEHPRAAMVVELRYFGGFSMPEIAAALEKNRMETKATIADAKATESEKTEASIADNKAAESEKTEASIADNKAAESEAPIAKKMKKGTSLAAVERDHRFALAWLRDYAWQRDCGFD